MDINPSNDRQPALSDLLAKRIVILDGAMGTMIQQRTLEEADFGANGLLTGSAISRATTTYWVSPSRR